MTEYKLRPDATHQELHRVPQQYLTVPAHIHVVGYVNDANVAPGHRKHFMTLTDVLGIAPTDIHWQDARAFAIRSDRDGRILVKLDVAQDHYTIQTWWADNAPPTFGRLPAYPADLEFPIEGKVTELDICWLGAAPSAEGLRSRFEPDAEILSSAVLGGKLHIATDYEPDPQGRERYLIFPIKEEVPPGQVEFIVDNIVRIENHFHLLYRPKINFDQAASSLLTVETGSAEEMRELNNTLPTAGTETLKESLHRLSAGFAQLATLNDEFQRNFSSAVTYKDILRTAYKAWREQAIDGYLPLSAPVLRSSTAIAGDYGQLLARVERVRRQKADMINILGTKIDLLERDQSMALQRSMNETTKSQMAMQTTIEGLYIFIVAFYLTELARIVFEALKEQGILKTSPNLLAALFIPFAIGAGLVLSGKAGHWLRGRRLQDETTP